MKNGRNIRLKNKKLRRLRSNLRKVLKQAIDSEVDRLYEKEDEIIEQYGFDNPKRIKIRKEIENLQNLPSKSIIQCASSGACLPWREICDKGADFNDFHTNLDMVYDASEDAWYCEACFNKMRDNLKPQNFFNEGVIVKKKAEKPCYKLNWCPYGQLAECFLIRREELEYTCLAFGHDCPVFYVSEEVTEQSQETNQKRMKLKHTLKDCVQYNDKTVIASDIKKPCYVLGLCPYGSIGDTFKIREVKNKKACKIFPHDCPAFYHAEKVTEKERLE